MCGIIFFIVIKDEAHNKVNALAVHDKHRDFNYLVPYSVLTYCRYIMQSFKVIATIFSPHGIGFRASAERSVPINVPALHRGILLMIVKPVVEAIG